MEAKFCNIRTVHDRYWIQNRCFRRFWSWRWRRFMTNRRSKFACRKISALPHSRCCLLFSLHARVYLTFPLTKTYGYDRLCDRCDYMETAFFVIVCDCLRSAIVCDHMETSLYQNGWQSKRKECQTVWNWWPWKQNTQSCKHTCSFYKKLHVMHEIGYSRSFFTGSNSSFWWNISFFISISSSLQHCIYLITVSSIFLDNFSCTCVSCYNRVLKCDVTNIWIFEIMGFVSIFGKSLMKNTYLPKISILLQFGSEILL